MTLSVSRITFCLFICAIILVLISFLGVYLSFHTDHHAIIKLFERFDVSEENTVPTWFSTVLMVSCAGLLIYIGKIRRANNCSFHRHWTLLGAIFVGLSIDEASSFHERFFWLTHQLWDVGGLLYYGWVIPGMFFVLILGIVYYKFLFSLPSTTRVQCILAGSLFVLGALGLEMLAGRHDYIYGSENLLYHVYSHLEESLEMIGVIILLDALLRYLKDQTDKMVVYLV